MARRRAVVAPAGLFLRRRLIPAVKWHPRRFSRWLRSGLQQSTAAPGGGGSLRSPVTPRRCPARLEGRSTATLLLQRRVPMTCDRHYDDCAPGSEADGDVVVAASDGDGRRIVVEENNLVYFMASRAGDSIKPRDVCVVGVVRTPMGGFLGSLSSLSATKLGSIAIKGALERANVDPSLVQEVFFGNVLSANLGQAPARQAALGAGIPNSVVCTTINKVCSSGLKAIMIAALSITSGVNDVVVAGGMESMSNAPKYLVQSRKGSRLGHDTIIDGMIKDGLWDVYNDFGMGLCAELCADQYSFTRGEQDSYAIQSFERGIAAQSSGAFGWEIVPVEISGGRGKPPNIVDKDDGLRQVSFGQRRQQELEQNFELSAPRQPVYDGAAALVLVSGEKALKLGLQVIAKIRGYADAAQAPELFPTAPALAIPKAIRHSGLKTSDVDYYEINEAFSVVALANLRLLNLDPGKLNVHGGAVSLGHPLGCSGARILVTLLGVLRAKNGKVGVAGVCNGGGGASALVVELMPEAKMVRPKL
nr:acetyl-CoA acetyltransferase, cytosolic 1-like [Ipomoea batatas]